MRSKLCEAYLFFNRKIGRLLLRKILNQGDILSDVKKQKLESLITGDQLTCDLCQIGIGAIQAVLSNNPGEDLISDIAVGVCVAVRNLISMSWK